MALDVMEKLGTQYTSFDAGPVSGNKAQGFCTSAFFGDILISCPAYTVDGGGYDTPNIAFYDSSKKIDDTTAWKFFNLSTINAAYKIYSGVYTDGVRYAYLTPRGTDAAPHGYAVRIDMLADYTTAAAYTIFDITSTIANGKGFVGSAANDGRYLYFPPYTTAENVGSGLIVRYDTQGVFDNAGSWSSFDLTTIDSSWKGYASAGYHPISKKVYFIPLHFNTTVHGCFASFDTQLPFNQAASFELKYLPTLNNNWLGYNDHEIVGNYLYMFAHYAAGFAVGGYCLKYDVTKSMQLVGSYETFNTLTLESSGARAGGWMKSRYDNYRYIYATQDTYLNQYGYLLRLDTWGDFTNATSWKIAKTSNWNRQKTGGYNGVSIKNNKVYLSPSSYITAGNFLVYDTVDKTGTTKVQLEDVCWMLNPSALSKGNWNVAKTTGNIPCYHPSLKKIFTLTNFSTGGYDPAIGALQFASPGYITNGVEEALFINSLTNCAFSMELVFKFNAFSTTTVRNYKILEWWQGATRQVVINAVGGTGYADLRIESNCGAGADYVATSSLSFINPTNINHMVYGFANGVVSIYLNGVELGYATRDTMIGDIGLNGFFIGGTTAGTAGFDYAAMNIYSIAKRNGIMPIAKIQANAAMVAAGDYSLGLKFNVDANGQVYEPSLKTGQSRLGIGFPRIGL
jgi:hypothetical protein